MDFSVKDNLAGDPSCIIYRLPWGNSKTTPCKRNRNDLELEKTVMSAFPASFLSPTPILSLYPKCFSKLYKAFSFWKPSRKIYYKKVTLSTEQR
jgi:hypothetical protein